MSRFAFAAAAVLLLTAGSAARAQDFGPIPPYGNWTPNATTYRYTYTGTWHYVGSNKTVRQLPDWASPQPWRDPRTGVWYSPTPPARYTLTGTWYYPYPHPPSGQGIIDYRWVYWAWY